MSARFGPGYQQFVETVLDARAASARGDRATAQRLVCAARDMLSRPLQPMHGTCTCPITDARPELPDAAARFLARSGYGRRDEIGSPIEAVEITSPSGATVRLPSWAAAYWTEAGAEGLDVTGGDELVEVTGPDGRPARLPAWAASAVEAVLEHRANGGGGSFDAAQAFARRQGFKPRRSVEDAQAAFLARSGYAADSQAEIVTKFLSKAGYR